MPLGLISGVLSSSSGDQAVGDDDGSTFENILQIGQVGLVNCVIMLAIIMWRGACFVYRTARRERKGLTFWKRVVFHFILWTAIACDIPMYCSFVTHQRYELQTYAFHKLESGYMFIAYSVVVSDWLAVLRDINEDSEVAYICKWWSLLFANLVVITICLCNFIECFKQTEIVAFTNGPIYSMGLASQFSSVLLLTIVILHSGLKLAYRLRTATEGIRTGERRSNPSQGSGGQQQIADTEEARGGIFSSPVKKRGSDNTNGSPGSPATVEDLESSKLGFVDAGGNVGEEPAGSSSAVQAARVRHSTSSGIEVQGWTKKRKLAIRQSRQAEFLAALRRLNIVMAACVLCNMLCITMLGLNFVLGYESSAQDYIFNVYLFWACYAWIPLWGPVLALLYLVTPQKHKRGSRRGRRRRLKRSNSSRNLDKSAEKDRGDKGVVAKSGRAFRGDMLRTGEVSMDLDVDTTRAEDLTTRLLPSKNNHAAADGGGGGGGGGSGDSAMRQNSDNKNNNINIIGFEGDDDAVLSGSRSGSRRVSVSSSISDDNERDRLRSGDGGSEYEDDDDGTYDSEYDDYDSEDGSEDDDERYDYDYEYHYESSSVASTSTVTDSVTSSILSEFSLGGPDGPRDVFRHSHNYQSRSSFSQGGQMSTSIRKAGLAGGGSYQPPSGNPNKHHQHQHHPHNGHASPRSEAADSRDDGRETSEDLSPQMVYLSSGQGSSRAYRKENRTEDYAYVARTGGGGGK